MAFVTLSEVFDHLSLTEDMQDLDGALLAQKLAAAQGHVERLLGFHLIDRYIDPADEPVEDDTRAEFPPDLGEAILQITAHWFDQREAAGPALREVPFGAREIITEHREWTF